MQRFWPVQALAIFVLAAVVHTWPLASAPGWWTRVDNADTALNAWAIAWVGMAVLKAPLDLFNGNIFFPEPRTVAFSEVMLPQALLGGAPPPGRRGPGSGAGLQPARHRRLRAERLRDVVADLALDR
jgi:hypothetical protein